MRHTPVSYTEAKVTFDSLDERARFLIARKFVLTPGAGRYARWLSKEDNGDQLFHMELTPANAKQCDNLKALDMRIRRIRPDTAPAEGLPTWQ
jgi:hypothetical protein